jgi:nucleotide-binding universal stress UspA family protein
MDRWRTSVGSGGEPRRLDVVRSSTWGCGMIPDDMTPPRIVVGVDGSAPSLEALAWAATEARLRRARLEVLHASFYRRQMLELYPGAARDEQAVLDRALAPVRAAEPTVEVVARPAGPPAAKALVDASDGADLLVVGSRGLGGFDQLLMGSVSNQCAHHAQCPVVIVRAAHKQA